MRRPEPLDPLALLTARLDEAVSERDEAAVWAATASAFSDLTGKTCVVWTYSAGMGRFSPAHTAQAGSNPVELPAELPPACLPVQAEHLGARTCDLEIDDGRIDSDLRRWLDQLGAIGIQCLTLRAHGQVVGCLMVVCTGQIAAVGVDPEIVSDMALHAATAMAITSAEARLGRAVEALQSSEKRGSAVVAAALDAVITMDLAGRIVDWNPQAERTFGWYMAEVLGRQLSEVIIPPDLRSAHEEGLARYRRTGKGRVLRNRLELRAIRRDGTEIPVELVIAELPGAERSLFVGYVRDLSDELAARTADASHPGSEVSTGEGPKTDRSRGHRHPFRELVERSPDVVFRYRTRPTFSVEYLSPAVTILTGHTPQAFYDDPDLLFAMCHPGDRHRLSAVLAEGKVRDEPLIVRLIASDGRTKWVENRFSTLSPQQDDDVLEGTSRDITESMRAQQKLAQRALHDPLTGLANRELLLAQLENAVAHHRAGRSSARIAVLYCDLDKFKSVNDSLGHAAGDDLLIAASERLQSCIRPSDVLARLGGDEFVILCDDIEEGANALRLARRIREAMAVPFEIAGSHVQVTVSIGIATTSDAHSSSDELLRQADIAMYQAKMQGRDGAEIYDQAMRREVQRRLEDEARLQEALAHGGITVCYQQIVTWQGALAGFEALARWPDGGHDRSGAWFVGLADESGLMPRLGRDVLAQACTQAASWAHSGLPVNVGVNVSLRHGGGRGLIAGVEETLAQAACDPALLSVELAEGALADDPLQTIDAARVLHRFGVRIALDGFGAGVSSLSDLSRIPLDSVKVDRRLVADLGSDDAATTAVSAAVGLAHSLGGLAVAVGVETAEQERRLKDIGCDLAQGFLYSEPVPASVATAQVESVGALEPAGRLRER